MSDSREATASKAVPILTYHSLDDSGAVTSVAPRDFREHMRILAERGFTGISLSALLDSWDGRRTLPARPVVITFDDGFANVLEQAAPCLADLGFSATIFMVSGRCGQTNDWPNQVSRTPRLPLLSWSELGQIAAAGFEIGAHGMTHRSLTEISEAEMEREIVESKTTIEQRLGQRVSAFAYPFGMFSRAICDVVREHFRGACTTELRRANPENDRYQLPRLDVYYLRRPALFQFFETLPGQAYLKIRGIGRRIGAQKITVPGPPGWPLVGHLPVFLADKLGFLTRCAKEYGGIVRLDLGGTTYLLNDPEDIRHVLETNNNNYTKTLRLTSTRGRWLSGHGLLTSTGAAHLAQRRMMQPVFHQRVLASLAESIVSSAAQTASGWENGAELNIAAEMMALAQRIIGRVLFGVDLLIEEPELGQAIRTRRRFIEYSFGSLFPFPEYLPNRVNREYRRAMKVINQAIDEMIRTRRECEAPPHDLLTMLMQVSYPDGSTMSDTQVRDEAVTLSITGFETIGDALAWTWYLLSRHPEAEAAVFAEVERECEGRVPSAADLPRLRYTGMVLSESMRLYPPTWLYVRVGRQEDTLPSGAKIPRGAKLYLSQYVMHRNPRYFPEPERFDPLRFADSAIKNRPKYAYFPFGGGPHICIGQGLAMMEGVLGLATIISRWRLSLARDQVITPEAGITLHPKGGILMRCNLRSR